MKLVVLNIKKKYKKSVVLDGISFEASDGECIGFVGRNGCGKSTLLSILAGVLAPDEGEIYIDGVDALKNSEICEKYIGYLPQTDPLPELMSVKDNLKLWCNGKEEYERAIKDFELSPMLKKKVSALSGGMKRRTSIACVMANNPKIMLLDEPTSSLDVENKYLVHEYMKHHLGKGGIILMVTHESEEMSLCSKVFRIDAGQMSNADGGKMHE